VELLLVADEVGERRVQAELLILTMMEALERL
jgi:hypothetical protein